MILFIDKLFNKIVMFLILFALFLSLYSLYDSYQIYEESKISENIQIYNPINYEYNNKNIIGWIKIDDTNIDYPILQGKNNTDYLTMNYKNEYSTSGSIFLDYRNNKLLKDDFSIIYGHNMSNKTMFYDLNNYKNKTYLDSHKNGVLYLNEVKYNIIIKMYKEINENDDIPYNLYLYKNNFNKKIYETITGKKGSINKMLLLSTCKRGQRNKRVILLCELK